MMETIKMDLGEETKVQIESIGGDLRISGRKGQKLEAQAPEHGDLKVEQDEDQITISASSAVFIYLPASTHVAINRIGGDARITGLRESLAVQSVGGDLGLRRVGCVETQWVGGDLTVRKMDGDLVVSQVGGDAIVESVDGSVRCAAVGGDLFLQSVQGVIDVSVGGDTSVEVVPQPEVGSRVVTGGDLSCYIPEGASATVRVNVGGEMILVEPGAFEEAEEGIVFRLGDGQGDVDLTAGADLWLRVGQYETRYADDWVADMRRDAQTKAAEMEARVGAIIEGAFAFDADRIGERVRRSVSKARKKAERARKRTNSYGASGKNDMRISFGRFGSKAVEVSEEERLKILQMVEQGKINVEDAEKLLSALEGEA